MMGGVSPETCWASFKIRNNKIFINCCILLVLYCKNSTMMYGSTKIKLANIFSLEVKHLLTYRQLKQLNVLVSNKSRVYILYISVSAISRNLILLLSSMNDTNEKDAEGETLRAATNRIFRMQCFTHTHKPAQQLIHKHLRNHSEEKHSRRSSNIPLGVSVSVLSQWQNIRVITS